MTAVSEIPRPRAPLESEKTLHAAMQDFGKRQGEQYQRIWDESSVAVNEMAHRIAPKVTELVGQPRGNFVVNHISNVLLFGLGLGTFILLANVASTTSSLGTPLFFIWLGFSWGWFYSLYRYRVATNAHRASVVERNNWLALVGMNAALEAIVARRLNAQAHTPVDDPALPFVPQGSMPQRQPYGVSHEGAEALCAAWMQFYGEEDAEVTRFTSDGGIDVTSLHYIAQVKNYSGTVGVEAIREMAGTALDDGRKPLFFTSGSYASGAVSFADRVGMPLFIYSAVEGTLTGANARAEAIFQTGL